MVYKRRNLTFLVIFVAIILSASTLDKPRILIIGDSISIGYTPYVKEHFEGQATVLHNPGNAGDTGRGLKNIRESLGDCNWDVIFFN